jgi:hypothetical protein
MKLTRIFASALAIALPLFAATADADVLVSGGRIVKIGNTRSPLDSSFVLFVEGGVGPCANKWIYFYPSGDSNPEIQKRAYTAALMAMATGANVDIEATTNNCVDAYFILVSP